MRALFLCSSDIHVRMFSPVIRELTARGRTGTFISLDRQYRQGATRMATSLGLDIVEVGDPIGSNQPFYHRSAFAIWRDILALRKPVSHYLDGQTADTLVVGNDRGLVERAWLRAARSRGMRTALVQDGRLGEGPVDVTWGRHLSGIARRLASAGMRASGLGDLAASQYGASGVDIICATGQESAKLLRRRAPIRSNIVITGQPRYDELERASGGTSNQEFCSFFTTPYEHAGLGQQAQDQQEHLIVRLREAFAERSVPFVVKPHPREDITRYAALLGESNFLWTGSSADLLRRSICAVITFSTVVEEAALVGCPVLVPADSMFGTSPIPTLPQVAEYPRVATPREMASAVGRLARDPNVRARLVEQQRAFMRRFLEFGDGRSAHRVAEALCV